MKYFCLVVISFIFLLALGCSSSSVGGRSYLLSVPSQNSSETPSSILIALHGYTSRAEWMRSMTGFNYLSNAENVIVVYPQGLLSQENVSGWNAGGFFESLMNYSDDVSFICGIIDELKSAYFVDSNRIYAVGHSNGGMMAYRLGAECSETFAAVGAISGVTIPPITPEAPVPVIHIHGESDSVVPFSGNSYFPSVMSSLVQWQEINGCSSSASVAEYSNYTCSEWSGSSADITLYLVKNHGHDWIETELDVRSCLWNFFKNHPKEN